MIYHIIDDQIIELTDDYIEYLYTKYVPDSSLIIHDGTIIPSIPNNIKHIIVNDACNPIDIEQHRSKINISQPYYVLSGLYDYYYHPDPTVLFFPYWAIWMSLPYGRLMTMPAHHFSNVRKKYKFSCLNGTYWNHRILTYLELSDRSYFKDMVFTFGNRPYHVDTVSELQLTVQELNKFSTLDNNVKFLPDERSDIDLSVDHPAYKETYVNLVTETTVKKSTPMLSEKTFKPIIAGQLFLLIASPGAVQFLRDIGIDTFDDIIDHGYDLESDIRIRIKMVLQQLDRLDQLDLESLYQQIKPRLIKNSEYFLSQEFRDQFPLNFG